MDLETALAWCAQRKHAVLITLRADGRAQSSDIVYAISDGVILISVTGDRAKTVNMRRDPRIVLHLTSPDSWSYVSLDGTVELAPITTSPDDATSDALVDYYTKVAGAEHDNWPEYRQAMIEEGRLIARFTPTKAVGQING